MPFSLLNEVVFLVSNFNTYYLSYRRDSWLIEQADCIYIYNYDKNIKYYDNLVLDKPIFGTDLKSKSKSSWSVMEYTTISVFIVCNVYVKSL